MLKILVKTNKKQLEQIKRREKHAGALLPSCPPPRPDKHSQSATLRRVSPEGWAWTLELLNF